MSHSRLPPSASKSWIHCTARPALLDAENLVSQDSKESTEGTTAHDHAAAYLKRFTPVPKEFKPVETYTAECLNIRNEHREQPGFFEIIETGIPLFYMPEGYAAKTEDDHQWLGTTDYAVITNHMIIFRDLKYGQGVFVDAIRNTQLAIYAWSLIKHYESMYEWNDLVPVDLGIVQPRYSGESPVRRWSITVGELREFCEHISEAVADIRAGRVKYAPGWDTCQFCPAKKGWTAPDGGMKTCPGLAAGALAVHPLTPEEMFDDPPKDAKLGFPESLQQGALTPAELLHVFKNHKTWQVWINVVLDYIEKRALSGDPVPGTKLVTGREGNRQWKGEDKQVEEFLLKTFQLKADERRETTLRSIAEIEKMLKEKGFSKDQIKALADWVTRSPGKPVCALEDDKRPAVKASAEDIFEDQTTEETEE